MKALIILLAVVTSCYATDDGDCFAQADGLRHCVCSGVEGHRKQVEEVLYHFAEGIEACFHSDDVKPYCALPSHQAPPTTPHHTSPPPPSSPPPHSSPKFTTPPADLGQCREAVEQTFQVCIKNTGVQLPPMPAGPPPTPFPLHPPTTPGTPGPHSPPPPPPPPGPGGPGGFCPGPPMPHLPPGVHDKFFPEGKFNATEVRNFASELCNNSAVGLKNLVKCAINVITSNSYPYLPVLFSLVEPVYPYCIAAEECNKTNVVPGECLAKFQNVSQAVCSCKPQVEAAFNSNECAAARQIMPVLPPLPFFEICNAHSIVNDPYQFCEDLKTKFKVINETIVQVSAHL